MHVSESIATITLNRPESYNALTPQGEAASRPGPSLSHVSPGNDP